ncbi:MAG TPA: response regulator [Gammaproteobacteria bacterium]|nr:response regulator [Gammaproteobacteria bacterium]
MVVLVVDDDQDTAESIRELLLLSGYDALATFDADSALDLAAKIHPSVVIADLVMPDIDGLEMCRRLKREPWTKSTVLIALSGWLDKRDEALGAGFDEFLQKPVTMDTLRSYLDRRQLPVC